MITPDEILEEYNFWKDVKVKIANFGLQSDGVMETAIDTVLGVFNCALYGNDWAMCTEDQWKEHLICAKRLYDIVKDWQCCDLDAVSFYKARVNLWATAIVAGIDPKELIDGIEPPVENNPLDNITDITTEVV